jgi:hypothetical protein
MLTAESLNTINEASICVSNALMLKLCGYASSAVVMM